MLAQDGQAVCPECGYAIGTKIPEEPIRFFIDPAPTDFQRKAMEEFKRHHGIPPAGPSLGVDAIGILKSPEEIAAIEHNQARYAELNKLRRGQANTYNETEYM